MRENYCGIDFGTSNSALSVVVDDRPRLVTLEGAGPLMPTAVYFANAAAAPLFGQAALDEHIFLGSGRLVRSIKSVLGSSLMSRRRAAEGAGRTYRDITALFMKAMKQRAESHAGHELGSVVLGRPVRFDDHCDEKDAAAQDVLEDIARDIGFKNVHFEYEPVAAAVDLARSVARETLVLVVDVGGGTSDFSIVRLGKPHDGKSAGRHDVLATAGAHIGGNDIDQALALDCVAPELGFNAPLRGVSRTLPVYPYLDLTTWHRIELSYAPAVRRSLMGFRSQVEDCDSLDRMLHVLANRLGHYMMGQVEGAKASMSREREVSMPLKQIDPSLHITVTAASMETATRDAFATMRQKISSVLELAGLRRSAVDVALLTGGSSRLAGLRPMIQEALPDARIVDDEPFSRVANGLAARARETFR